MLSHTALKRLEQLPKLSVTGKRVNGLLNLMKCDLLWERAYERIARNRGSLTPGVDGETLDGFSPERLRPPQGATPSVRIHRLNVSEVSSTN
jgi:RNA-directed DNA polymerase